MLLFNSNLLVILTHVPFYFRVPHPHTTIKKLNLLPRSVFAGGFVAETTTFDLRRLSKGNEQTITAPISKSPAHPRSRWLTSRDETSGLSALMQSHRPDRRDIYGGFDIGHEDSPRSRLAEAFVDLHRPAFIPDPFPPSLCDNPKAW